VADKPRIADDPYRILTRDELAAVLGLSSKTLARWATEGCGPIPIRLGPRRVGYRASEVCRWIDSEAGGMSDDPDVQ
jgi:predicted DNA-binding transcriptional regulator AlpA